MSSGQFPIAVGLHSPSPSSSIIGRLLRRKLRGTIETQAEVAIYQFPGWTLEPEIAISIFDPCTAADVARKSIVTTVLKPPIICNVIRFIRFDYLRKEGLQSERLE